MKKSFFLCLLTGLSFQVFSQLGIPSHSSPANGSVFYVGSSINFSWTPVTDAVSYDLEFDTGTGYAYLTNVSATAYSMTLVASNTGPHTWHIRARSASSTGNWSATQNYTVVGIPSTPTLASPATASNITYNSSTNFSWNGVQNATGYKIQFDNDAPIVVAGTSYPSTFTTLGTHTWKVLSFNPAGESSWSAARNFTVVLGTPSLTSPANTFTTYVGSTINFSWTPVGGATSYDVELDPGLGYSSITNVSGTTMNLTLSASSVGSHTWHVRAKNGTNTGSWSGSRSYTVVGIPAVPTTNFPQSGSNVNYNSNTTFFWNTVNGATGYQIQFDSEAPITVSGNFYARTFNAFGNHTWKVLSFNDAGESAWSAAKIFTVVLSAPQLNSPSNKSTSYVGTNLGFSWSSVTGATSYDIEIDEGLGTSTITNVPSVSYQMTLTEALVGQHTWHVRAVSGTTLGQWSQTYDLAVAGKPATPVLTFPTTEANVTYEIASNFIWNSVPYATSYQIQFDADAPLTITSSNYSKTFNTLGNHTWKVKAINAAGESSWSAVNNFTVVLGVPNQSSPANGSIFYVGETASFSWSSVAGASSYDLEFDPGLGTATLTNVSGISSNVTFIPIHAGTHTWHIRAKNGTTNSVWSPTRSITVVGIPGIPTTTSPASGSTIFYDAVSSFSWGAVANATAYKIQFDSETPITVTGTSYQRTYSSLGSHTWRVLALNDAGESAWSSSKTFTVNLGIPNMSSPANGFTAFINTTLDFTWTSVAGATSYDIEFDSGLGSASISNVAVTSKQLALVAANVGNHTWRVRAKNGTTTGQWSQTRSYTVAGIPGVPVTINPPSEGTVPYNGSAFFAWNQVQGATSYLIQFDSEAPIAVTGTNFQRTFSTMGSHTWKVKAVNAAGESAWSSVKNFTVALGTPNLTSPANGSIEYVGATLEFSWTSVSGATSYDVEFDSGLGYAYLTNVAGTTLSMPLTNSNVGPHTWHVRAKINTIAGPWSGNRSYTVAGKPTVPVLVIPANGSSVTSERSVQFSWNNVANATSYKIQFDSETPIDVSGTSYIRTFTTLGNHSWKVLASNEAGDSDWSSNSLFTVELGIPTLTSPANAVTYYVGSTINFSWTPVTGATSYDVEFDAGLGISSITNVTTASLNLVLTSVHAGPHTWHVRAKTASSVGAWSVSRTYQVFGNPSVPVLIAPADASTIPYDTPTSFTWSAVASASGYQLQFDSETPITVSGTSYSRSFSTQGIHTWKVLASNAAGKGEWSNPFTFSAALGIPTLNTPIDAASVNAGATINFAWTAVTGATSYDIEFDGGTTSASLSNVTGTSMNMVTTSTNAGQHTWRVRARLNTTTGNWSPTRSYSILSVPTVPVLVTPAVNESIPCNTSFIFTWNTVQGATAYKVQFDTDAPVNVAGTSYTRSFNATGQHSWKVLASNSAGESAWSPSSAFNVDLGNPTLSSPANAFTFFVGSTITFSWTSVACANSYDIEIDAGMPNAYLKNVPGTSVNLQTDKNSTGNHTWRVRAKLDATNGQWSSTQSYIVLGLPAVPVLNSPANGATIYSESTTNFTWNAVGNAIGYQIQFDNEAPITVSGTTYSRSFNSAGIHNWKVLATNDAGNSDWSPARTFTLVIGTPVQQTKVLNVSPDNSWNFGTVTVNNTNSKSFSLQNTGNSTIKVSNLLLTGAHTTNYKISDPSLPTFDIVPGGTVVVTIGFKPLSEGLKDISLVIENNSDNASPAKSIAITGTGTLVPTKSFSISPDVLFEYGNLLLNTTMDKIFSIQNMGTASLNVSSITLTGLNSDQFTITTPAVTTFDLAAGGSQQVTVRFRPTATGIKTANLIIANNSDNASPTKQVTLNGTGVIQQTVTLPILTTASISGITAVSAISGGNVTTDGGGLVTAKGICLSKNENPTISDNKTVDGTGTGSFVSYLSGLTIGTTYHVRAYATNSAGTAYGSDFKFTTLALPTVSTAAVTSVTSTTSVSGGNITEDGGSAITSRGLCWSTKEKPTIADSKTNDGADKGTFVSSLSGLTAGTTYYARAYATNGAGTSYGEEVVFKTQSMAILTTAPITSVSASTALGGGNISSDGGAMVTARGVCWSKSLNPTILDTKTLDGTGHGSFTSTLTNLTAGTSYHVRAYATNSVGTSYGNDILFVTPSLATVSTISAVAASATTALGKGDVTFDGGSAVLEKGLCWSVAANPTIADSKTASGSGTGTFSDLISGLSMGSTYHVRAYATNAVGSSYGSDIVFTTPSLATVTTLSATANENASTTATGKGNVVSDGGSTVTEKGFCWSQNANPTIGDARTTEGTGIGTFSDNIAGLTPGTVYHLRAYAINSVGTSYGSDLTFVTSVNNGVYNISSFYQIYPNPSHGQITIKSKEETPVDMSIFSPEGRLLINSKLTKQINDLNLNLTKGVYIVVLKCEKATGSYQIIIL